ncbi:MAG: hypothetical protein ACXVCV_13980, partial [Polyangia bacterium]
LLWELTTGRRLYTGESDFEVMRKMREEDPPRPSTVGFAYPLALERIVLKGLKRNRDERYASAEELLLELEAFAREARVPVSSVRLSKYMRELFRDQIEAWNRQQRGEASPAALAAAGDEVARTETSVPGPAPPIMHSDPAVPQLTGRRGGRAWTAVAIGLVVGSLATWLAARHEAAPRMTPAAAPVTSAAAPVKPLIAPVAPAAAPVKPVAAPVTPAAAPPSRAMIAPRPARAAVELPTPAAPPPVTRPAAASPAPSVAKPIVYRSPAPPRRVIKRPPPKKPPPNWDPESILPP